MQKPLSGDNRARTSQKQRKSSIAAKCLLCCIRIYQYLLSPILHLLSGPGGGCRFQPTCSKYAYQAIQTHGFVKGSLLSFKRVCKCHPWNPGGDDPVP